MSLVGLFFTSAVALAGGDRPIYGIEGTITNRVLTELNCDVSTAKFARAANAVMRSTDPRARLGIYQELFPRQMGQFDRFLNAFFAGRPRPAVEAHKGRYPAYLRTLSDGSWLRTQFEIQAIELQATPTTLPKYLRRTAEIDRTFYAAGKRTGLRPHRGWGMGHVHEGLNDGYRGWPARVLRNRLVHELRDVYFWTLVGPDIEAAVHWDEVPVLLGHFADWLDKFDGWTSEPWSRAKRKRVGAELKDGILIDPVFSDLTTETKAALYKAAYVVENLDLGDAELESGISEIIMSMALRFAFAHAAGAGLGVAIELKQKSDRSRDAGDVSETLEFRRIPAYRDADEAARWMHLLEGRYRLARDTTALVPLVRPAPPRNDRERLALLERYVLSAGANPRDYARFLPLRLAARVWLKSYAPPRWRDVRARLLCESALDAGGMTAPAA